MPTTTSSNLLDEAVALHRKGALADAAARYREVLRGDPQNADALYYLAQLSCQQGDLAGGADLARRALGINPKQGRAHNLLGMALSALGRPQEALASFDAAITCSPELSSAHGARGDALVALGRLAEAVESYDRSLKAQPQSVENWCNRGAALQELGRYGEALTSYEDERVLALKPDFAEMHWSCGNVQARLGRRNDAIASYDRALALRPDYEDALMGSGHVLRAMQRTEDALASYERACAINPRLVAALVNRGLAQRDLGRLAQALESYDTALSLDVSDPAIWNHRAVALHELGRHADALTSCDRALSLKADYADAHFNRGNAYYSLNRLQDALQCFEKTLTLVPNHVEALVNRGAVLFKLRQIDKAAANYDTALAIQPDCANALIGRGTILFDRGHAEEALICFDQVLKLSPNHLAALNNRGLALMKLGRRPEAVATQERVLALAPHDGHAYSSLMYAHLATCDWSKLDSLTADLKSRLSEGRSVLEPFAVLEFSDDPMDHLRCAQTYARAKCNVAPRIARSASPAGKIRLAYLSADFRRHPVAYAIAELIEIHDRSRFEVIGISYGQDDGSDIRGRIVKAFDKFIEASSLSDADVARLMAEQNVGIAVDLMGYTENCRPGILAARPAPVQVNYLGYSGTMGAEFIDYMIADASVVPFSEQPLYAEKIVHLPDTFMVSEGSRTVAPSVPTRAQAGLPERGFVFCSFNNTWKIRREMFNVWMKLLRDIDGSVLWLAQADAAAVANLRREAQSRGVDPARIVFAGKVPERADHLARHRLADLFLDTLPYNAHSTVSDALWTGLPVLTCTGATFASRIAASVLRAVGLAELVTNSLEDYEAMAHKLSADAPALAAIKSKLANNLKHCPLFDSHRYRRHIEAAYATMWDRHLRGHDPANFSVDPIETGDR